MHMLVDKRVVHILFRVDLCARVSTDQNAVQPLGLDDGVQEKKPNKP